jgi:hypothetical protein
MLYLQIYVVIGLVLLLIILLAPKRRSTPSVDLTPTLLVWIVLLWPIWIFQVARPLARQFKEGFKRGINKKDR